MKQTITLLFLLLCISVQAQITVDNFEQGNRGWSTVSRMGYTNVHENEYKTGINLSNYVLFTQHAAGDDNWAGAILSPYAQSGYKYLHAYMYRNNANKPNLKVSDTNAKDLEPVNPIVAGQWQDVVFDISDYEKSGIEFIMFMVDRTDVTELAWMLIDEILLSNDPQPRTDIIGGNTEPVTPPDGDYHIVWEDEFSGTALDRNIWNIEVNGDGGGNNELQYYCEKAVSLQDGNLLLTATREEYNGKHFTSGRINSMHHVYFTHGKIEASIKLPKTANGLWPAFWMMGNDYSEVGWPRCGEIDILEMGNANGISAGTQDRYFNGACHWGFYRNGGYPNYAKASTWDYSLQDGNYHTFTCIWNDEKVEMYVDMDKYPNREPYYSMGLADSDDDWATGKYFHKPFFILFNLAIGGNFTGIHDASKITALANGPQAMYVDWVRVYQRGDASETFVGQAPDYTNTALESLDANTSIVRVEYFDLQGRQVGQDAEGLVIKRVLYSDGNIRVQKILR